MAEQQPRSRASRSGTSGRTWLTVAVLAAAGTAVWLYGRAPAADAPAPAAVQAPIRTPEAFASEVVTSTPAASASGVASVVRAVDAASARASEAAAAAMEKWSSPAEALRKVQIGLNGGTPEEALEAAQTLHLCLMMSGAPESLYALRDRPNDMPELAKKMKEAPGGINKVIEFAEGQGRRCQVFDQATMERRMELFQRAYDGGAESAAVDYLTALQNPLEKQKPDPALIAKLQDDVRKAAAVGEPAALQHLSGVTGDRARELGVTPVQSAGYQAAWKIIVDERYPGMSAVIEKATGFSGPAAPAKPLSAAEQRDADALTQQIVDAWRRKRKGG